MGIQKLDFNHRPVLLEEVLINLNLQPRGLYVDCTLGGGGHSLEILRRTAPEGMLLALDQDQEAIDAAQERLKAYSGRFNLVKENFSRLPKVFADLSIAAADGILYDLGVSSYQLDNPSRGFSYMQDAPLDMRMDVESPTSAWHIVNESSEGQLAKIIKDFGEEKFARRIAGFIVEQRKNGEITNTGKLVEVIKAAIPARARREGPHPAKRTFQAIRIAVNNELGIIRQSIEDAVPFLKPGGRMCIITFHSLEDRIVKETFREMANPCRCPKDFPVCACGKQAVVKLIAAGGITPTAQELETNPRARSARLRVAEKLPLF